MLYYDRIDISEGTDLAKSNNSKECMICHYWLFNDGFKSQGYACNSCHDLTMVSVNISDSTIITVKILVIAVLLSLLKFWLSLYYS